MRIDSAGDGSSAARMPARLAQADAQALIRDNGAEAYRETRRRERDVILPDGTSAGWRRGGTRMLDWLKVNSVSGADSQIAL
jgi:hypothetical protein